MYFTELLHILIIAPHFFLNNINLCEDCNFIKRCENHDYINLNLEKTLKNYTVIFIAIPPR